MSNNLLIFSQCVCVWDWTNETDQPLLFTEINPKHGFQVSCVFFKHLNVTSIFIYIHMIPSRSNIKKFKMSFRSISFLIQTIALNC